MWIGIDALVLWLIGIHLVEGKCLRCKIWSVIWCQYILGAIKLRGRGTEKPTVKVLGQRPSIDGGAYCLSHSDIILLRRIFYERLIWISRCSPSDCVSLALMLLSDKWILQLDHLFGDPVHLTSCIFDLSETFCHFFLHIWHHSLLTFIDSVISAI